MKQITFQNIVKDLDVHEWLSQIGGYLRMQDIHVSMGFSYLCRKTTAAGEDITYTWTAPSMALEKTKLFNKAGWDEYTSRFKSLTEYDLLHKSFDMKEMEPARISGYQPYKLVCCYLWIRLVLAYMIILLPSQPMVPFWYHDGAVLKFTYRTAINLHVTPLCCVIIDDS